MVPNIQLLKPWLDTALGFVYPEVCQICSHEHAAANEGFVCGACRQKAQVVKPPFCERCGLPFSGDISTKFTCSNCHEMELHFSSARSAVLSEGVVREIIHRYKYRQGIWFEPYLGELLVRQAGAVVAQEGWNMIVPVPLHPARQREREFNQAERLAGYLARSAQIPVNSSLLRRIEPTTTQTRLNRKERAENMRRAFSMQPKRKLNGERVVVVDDVLTTGATTNACARILLKAGAREVCVWTVARGL